MSMPAFDPGAVHVSLRWQDGGARDVSIRVSRPTAAAMLCGRNADEAVRMLPLMYAICGVAQGAAARLALAAARGEERQPAIDAGVLAEAQREHLWRLLLDWPQALGLQRQEALFVEGRKALQGDSFAEWVRATLREHLERAASVLRAAPLHALPADPQLPPLAAADTVSLWPRLDGAFAAAPEYRGAPASTGARARHPGLESSDPLIARVAARIADLTTPAGLGRASAATVAPGIGRAAVETARGLLLHEIVLDGDRVADYVIVAPTEWNFHPRGTLKTWIESMTAANAVELEQAAARAVLAFDPCVRAEIDMDAGARSGHSRLR